MVIIHVKAQFRKHERSVFVRTCSWSTQRSQFKLIDVCKLNLTPGNKLHISSILVYLHAISPPFLGCRFWSLWTRKTNFDLKFLSSKFILDKVLLGKGFLRNFKPQTKTRIDFASVCTTYVFLLKFLCQGSELFIISIFIVP